MPSLPRLALLLLMIALPAHAAPPLLRICVDAQSHLPFINGKGEGLTGRLIRKAAQQSGIAVSFVARPVTRCREEIRAGVSDAFPTTPFTPSLTPFMAFPMRQGKAEADPERAVLVARAMVFRRKGSKVDWDGTRFTGLERPVLVPFGAALLVDRLMAMQLPVDDKGKTLAGSFAKLIAERGDAVVGAEHSGLAQLAIPPMSEKIDMLPIPFSEEPYYMAVSQAFYAANPGKMEQLWTAISRIRNSDAYRRHYEKIVPAFVRDPKE